MFKSLVIICLLALISLLLSSNVFGSSWIVGSNSSSIASLNAHYAMITANSGSATLTFICRKQYDTSLNSYINHYIVSLNPYTMAPYEALPLSTSIALYYQFDNNHPGKTFLKDYGSKPQKLLFSQSVTSEFISRMKNSQKLKLKLGRQEAVFDLSYSHLKLNNLDQNCSK